MNKEILLKSLNESFFIFIYALIFSLIEIEVEGKYGWAKNLPTEYFYKKMTVYHIFMGLFIILSFCKIYFKSIKDFKKVIFFTTCWFLIEDFLWFVFNPHFKLKKYKKKHIWWHAEQPWICGIPFHNIYGVLILVSLIYFCPKDRQFLSMVLSFLIIMIIISIILAPKYHKFYKNIRKKNKKSSKK